MSSQAPSVSSGVRNLRAMFENKDTSSSPPDRGRSPALSIGSNGTSPRPLSKVRTSFVAVERGGQLGIQFGLKRDTSTDSDMANRRGSFSMNEETDANAIVEKKKSIADEYQARKQSSAISETIPEVAVELPSPENGKQFGQTPKGKAVAAAASRLGGSPEKAAPAVEKGTKSAETKSTKATSSAALTAGPTTKAAPPTSTQKANVIKSSAKPAPISTKAAPASRSAKTSVPKTPTTPSKTPTTPSHARPVTTKSAATSTKDAVKPAATKTTRPAASASVPKPNGRQSTVSASTAATKKPTMSAGTASSTGFVKPRPKSPTKPVKLPSSMTAPTASSLSKLNNGSAPAAPVHLSTGPAQTAASRSRSPSRTAAAKTEAPVRRQPSATARGRSSIGPPPAVKKQPSRSSLSKNVAPSDEGFLARMMRPTTSSASKTHDKLTPEKAKLASRPVTRDGYHEGTEGSVGSPSKSRDRSVKAIRKSIPSKSAEIAVPAVAVAAATVAVAGTAAAVNETGLAESASEAPAAQETPAVSSVEETIPEVAEEPDFEDEKAAEPAPVAEEPAIIEAKGVVDDEEAATAPVEEPEAQIDGQEDEIINGPSEIKDVEEDAGEDEQEIVETPETAEAEEDIESVTKEEEVAHLEEDEEEEKEGAKVMVEQEEVSVPEQATEAEEEAKEQTEPAHTAEVSQVKEQDGAEEVPEDKDTPEDSEKDDEEEEEIIATKEESATAVAKPEPVKEELKIAEPLENTAEDDVD